MALFLISILNKLGYRKLSQTTMKTQTSTLDRLRSHGKCGDSLDTVLNKVLNRIEDKLKDLEDKVADMEENLDDDE